MVGFSAVVGIPAVASIAAVVGLSAVVEILAVGCVFTVSLQGMHVYVRIRVFKLTECNYGRLMNYRNNLFFPLGLWQY